MPPCFASLRPMLPSTRCHSRPPCATPLPTVSIDSLFMAVRLNGAWSFADADAAARAVANSALVKTSWHGGDPNWGRIIDALGYSPARIVEEKVDIGYSAPDSGKVLWSLKRGQPTSATFKQLCAAVAG